MHEFASSWRNDKGASLSIAQLKRLGHAFKEETLDLRVGGRDQIAVITDGGLQLEPSKNLPPIRKPAPFVLLSCPQGKEFAISSYLPAAPVPTVFQHCEFTVGGEELPLDGYIYLKCKFRNVFLRYEGGDTVFESDNLVEGNSYLQLAPSACRRPDIANQLAKRFDFVHGGSLLPGTDQEVRPPCAVANTPERPKPTKGSNSSGTKQLYLRVIYMMQSCSMFARGVVCPNAPPPLAPKTRLSKSRVSITCNLIENTLLHLQSFQHLQKTGRRESYSSTNTSAQATYSFSPLSHFPDAARFRKRTLHACLQDAGATNSPEHGP